MRSKLRFCHVSCSILLAAMTLTIPASAQQAANKSTGQPPLIDRELFLGNPEIAGAQISPDGKFIAFLKPYKDTRNVWVKRVEEPFSAAKLVTSETKRPIPCNPIDPSSKSLGIGQPRQMAKHVEPDILEDVVSAVLDQLPQKIREPSIVPGDQLAKRGLVARLRAHDQDPLVNQVEFIAHASVEGGLLPIAEVTSPPIRLRLVEKSSIESNRIRRHRSAILTE